MMDINRYLESLCSGVFKILPMKEDEIRGADNKLTQYIDKLVTTMKGGIHTFPELNQQKNYIYAINNLQFLISDNPELKKVRSIVLSTVSDMSGLAKSFRERCATCEVRI